MYLFASRREKDQIIKSALVIRFSCKSRQQHVFHIHSDFYPSLKKAITMADLDDDDIPNLTESSGDEDSDVGEYLNNCYGKCFIGYLLIKYI